jgi:hypothetical protein
VFLNLAIRAANVAVNISSSTPSYSNLRSEFAMHRSIKPVARRISANKRRKSAAVEGFVPGGEVVVYQAPDGEVKLDVRLKGETVWLTQVQMAELFGRGQSVISRHLRNVFKEGELEQKSNMQNLHIAGSDKPVGFYSLDAIISVGYRVNSKRGTQFRIWATNQEPHRRAARPAAGDALTAARQRLRIAERVPCRSRPAVSRGAVPTHRRRSQQGCGCREGS